MSEKIVVIGTHGADDPERATLPFVAANAALAMDVQATAILQGSAVLLAAKGGADHVLAPELPPLKNLIGSFLEQGGQLLICTPCIKARQITPDMLIEGAKPIAAARVIQECTEAKATLNY